MIIKNATFDTSKKILGPVHLHPKTDKWDYLRSPIMKKKSFLVLTSGNFLEALGSRIGTGSIFCLSFSLSNRVCTLEKITNLKFNIFYGSHKNLTKFPSFSLTLLYTIIEKFLGKINFTSLQCAAVVCQGRCSEGRSKNIAKSHIDSATLMT